MSEGKKPEGRMVPEHVRRMLEAARRGPGASSDPAEAPAADLASGAAPAPAAPIAAQAGDAAGVEAAPAAGLTEETPATEDSGAAVESNPEPAIRAQAAALHKQAIMDIQAGHSDVARERLEQSLALERDIGVPADLAATSIMLGQVLFSQNERERGLELARESLEIFQSLDAAETQQVQEIVTQMEALIRMDAPGGSRDLLRHGIAALQDGDGELAGELLDASLRAAAAAGDGAVAAGALHHLGLLLFSGGHLPEAEAALKDSIELNRALGEEEALAAGLALLGQVVVGRGDRTEGLRLLRESLLTWNALHRTDQAARVKELIADYKAAPGGRDDSQN